MKKIPNLAIICFLATTTSLNGQTLKFYKQFTIPDVINASIDQGDNLFIAERSGNVHKYNQDGQLILSYSPAHASQVTNLEAWETHKIFLFFNDLQRFLILDRFLSPISDLQLPSYLVGYAKLATLSPDNMLWVIDEIDLSLKKYTPQYKQILSVTSLDFLRTNDSCELTDIKMYQNRLYISDPAEGVFVFDNLGNYLKTLPVTGVKKMNFYRDCLLIPDTNEVKLYNIYNAEFESDSFNYTKSWKEIICGNKYLYFLADKQITVFQINR